MMDVIEDVLSMWEEDSKIDSTEPGHALLDIPKLHAKYLRILSEHKRSLKVAEFRFNTLKKLKYEYYTGKLDEETLRKKGWEPFPYILKSEISNYYESDEDLNALNMKKAFHTEVIDVCTAILKELNSRTYQLKAYIDYEKFIQGG